MDIGLYLQLEFATARFLHRPVVLYSYASAPAVVTKPKGLVVTMALFGLQLRYASSVVPFHLGPELASVLITHDRPWHLQKH